MIVIYIELKSLSYTNIYFQLKKIKNILKLKEKVDRTYAKHLLIYIEIRIDNSIGNVFGYIFFYISII